VVVVEVFHRGVLHVSMGVGVSYIYRGCFCGTVMLEVRSCGVEPVFATLTTIAVTLHIATNTTKRGSVQCSAVAVCVAL